MVAMYCHAGRLVWPGYHHSWACAARRRGAIVNCREMSNPISSIRWLIVVTTLLVMIAVMPALAQEQNANATTSAGSDHPHSSVASTVPEQAIWNTFHGQLNAQKYSPLQQINVDNVDELEKVWTLHTGDIADGSGDVPPTVWSATPVFANNTLYISTPFYRVFALDPATGDVKW